MRLLDLGGCSFLYVSRIKEDVKQAPAARFPAASHDVLSIPLDGWSFM